MDGQVQELDLVMLCRRKSLRPVLRTLFKNTESKELVKNFLSNLNVKFDIPKDGKLIDALGEMVWEHTLDEATAGLSDADMGK